MFDLFTLADADLWSTAGWTMVHFLWLGALVGAAAAACRVLLRRANADLRYIVTLAWLVVLVALPAGIAAWMLGHTPRATSGAATVQTPMVDLTVAAPSARTSAEPIIELHQSNLDTADENLSGGESAAASLQNTAAAAEPSPSPSLQGRGISLAALAGLIPYLPWVWIVGTPITFGLLLTGVAGSRRLQRASRLVDDVPLAEILARLMESLRITRCVTVAVCERIASPVLIGIVRPIILLPPAALTGWSPDEIEMVLLHELAHVRRWDNFINLLQRFVESLLFFHPAVWLVSSWVRREREACCDAVVVGRTNRPHAYAEMLLALAAQMPRSVLFHPVASSAMAAGPLRSRIRRILQVEDDPMLVSGKSLTIVLGSLLVAATLAVLYVPTIGQAEDSTTENTESTANGKDIEKAKSKQEELRPIAESSSTSKEQATQEKESVTNMKKIALAILNYEAAHGTLPPQAICDANGRPLLSWRVLVLPFLEEAELYNEFHRDEPWDSEHNRKLIARMPAALANPMLKEPGKTNYLAVVGEECAFNGSPSGLGLQSNTDGTANTIDVVEADADQAVEWTRPQDWNFDRNNPTKGLGAAWPDGWHAAYVDGHIKKVTRDAAPDAVGIAFTRNGREQKSLTESADRSAGVEGAIAEADPAADPAAAANPFGGSPAAGAGVEGGPAVDPKWRGLPSPPFPVAGVESGPVATPADGTNPFGGAAARPDVANAVPKEKIPPGASEFAKAKLFPADISERDFVAGINELLASSDLKNQKLLVAFPSSIDGNHENQLHLILKEYKKTGRLTEVSTAWIEGDKIEVFFEKAASPTVDPFAGPPADSHDPRTGDAAKTSATNPFAAAVTNPAKEGEVVAEFPRETAPQSILMVAEAAKKKNIYLDMEDRGDKIALVAKPAPKEADWPAMLGESPRKERVIAEKAWQRLGLKLVPLNQLERFYQQGVKIVGGNVPQGLPLPSVLTNMGGNEISDFDGLLNWIENNSGPSMPIRCYATADGKQYLFDANPPVDKVTMRIASRTATGPSRQPARFPSLEDQQLADLAYKRLGLELEALGADDLKRAQALGFEGGVLVVSGSAGGPNETIRPKDLLVGLHVWPTTSMKGVAEVLDREDLNDLNPLKFYVVRHEQTGPPSAENPNEATFRDVLHTGRVSVQSGGGWGGGRGSSSRSTPTKSQGVLGQPATNSGPYQTPAPDRVTPKVESNSPSATTPASIRPSTPAPAPERTVAAYDVPKVLAKQAERLISNADSRWVWDDSGRFIVQATKDTHERFSRILAATPKWRQPAAARDRAAKPVDVKTAVGKWILEWRTLGLVLGEEAGENGTSIRVIEVQQGSPAAWYDLRPGDRIPHLGSFEVTNMAELRSVLDSLLSGFKRKDSTVHINWTRVEPNGRSRSLTADLPLHPDIPEEASDARMLRGFEFNDRNGNSVFSGGTGGGSTLRAAEAEAEAPLAPNERPSSNDPPPAADERSLMANTSPRSAVANAAPPVALPIAPAAPPATAPVYLPPAIELPAETPLATPAPPPASTPLDTSEAVIIPPPQTDAAELDVLRERLKAIEQQYKKTEVLHKDGLRGGDVDKFETQGYELALARGELALAEGKRDKAIEEFEEASKRAKTASEAVQARYNSGNVTYDVVLRAIRNLSDIKLKLIGLQKKARAEMAPAYVPPAATYDRYDSGNPRDVPAASSDKSSFRYDGKTFGSWRDAWKTELSTEKRHEAIKALAAFARAGYGNEATGAILDVAGEYDFQTLDGTPEGRLKETVINELAPTYRRSMAEYWVPELAARLEKEPKKWTPLAILAINRLKTDDKGAIETLQELAELGPEGLRSVALAAVIRAAQMAGEDARLDGKTKKLVDGALTSKDAAAVKTVLQALVYTPKMEVGSPSKVIYRPAMLAMLLFHSDLRVRQQARGIVWHLEAGDAEQIAEDMRAVLADKSRSKDHADAVRALGALGPRGKGAIPMLQKLLLDDSQSLAVRVAAGFAIDSINGGTDGQNLIMSRIVVPEDQRAELSRLIQSESQM